MFAIGMRPTVAWPITVLCDNKEAPSKHILENVLGRTNMNVCKHLRYTDAFVSRLDSPDCKKFRGPTASTGLLPYCRCSSCMWQFSQPNLARTYIDRYIKYTYLFTGGRCESCGTDVYFETKADNTGEDTRLAIIVYGCVRRRLVFRYSLNVISSLSRP